MPPAAGPKRPRARRRSVCTAESPLRSFFGTQGLQLIQPLYAQHIKAWHDSQDIPALTEGK